MLEKLQESAARLELSEEIAGFGVWEVNHVDGTVTISRGMARLNGRPEGAPLHMSLKEWIDSGDPEQPGCRSRRGGQVPREQRGFLG